MNALSPGAALFTDLYEVTMAAAYLHDGLEDRAVFELFFRNLPPTRSYVVVAGLEDVLSFLEDFHLDATQIDYLRTIGRFDDGFLERLRSLRFTGEVWAMPEGSVAFGNEPVLQVVAPIVEAQWVETFLINQIHLHSVIASKAARIVDAARGRQVVEFGARRAQGFQAGVALARAAWIAGASGSSNLLPCSLYGIPPAGTMAHSFVQAHADERKAFETFARLYPGTTLLVDTYDTLAGVERVIEMVRSSGGELRVGGIRLDSGDLVELSLQARRLLDGAGLGQVKIFASGDLDEWEIARLLDAGAPIDAFGVGTRMAVADGAPTIGFVYKLVEYAGEGRAKLSSAKVLHPGRKQVFRAEREGKAKHDVIARFDERLPGRPLLVPVFRDGKRLHHETLDGIRARALRERQALPDELRGLEKPQTPYPVEVSERLAADLAKLRAERSQRG